MGRRESDRRERLNLILSQPEIRCAVDEGKIVFSPALEENQWGEASVDLRLGFSFTKLKKIEGITISVCDGLAAVSHAGFSGAV